MPQQKQSENTGDYQSPPKSQSSSETSITSSPHVPPEQGTNNRFTFKRKKSPKSARPESGLSNVQSQKDGSSFSVPKSTKNIWLRRESVFSLIVSFGAGFNNGYNLTSITPYLDKMYYCWEIGDDEKEWFTGIISAALIGGAMIGSMLCGPICDRLGRKWPITTSAIVSIVACALSCISYLDGLGSVWLGVMRAILGFAVGFMMAAGPMYVAEICPAQIRGRHNTLLQIFVTIGILISFGVGAAVNTAKPGTDWSISWIILAVGCVWCLPMIAISPLLKESPTWLARKAIKEAKKPGEIKSEEEKEEESTSGIDSSSMQRVRLTTPEQEEKEILQNLDESTSTMLSASGDTRKHSNANGIDTSENSTEEQHAIGSLPWKTIFRDYTGVVILGLVLALAQQLTGINAVMLYGPQILTEIIDPDGTNSDTEDSSVISIADIAGVAVSGWNCLTTFIGMFFVDRVGRKPLMFWGMVLISGALFLMWISKTFLEGTDALAPIFLIGLVVYIVGFEIGPGPIFFVLVSELYPPEVKGRVISMVNAILWVANLLVVLCFNSLDSAIHGWTWFIFMIIAILAVISIKIWGVETRGMELHEIKKMVYKPRGKAYSITPQNDDRGIQDGEDAVALTPQDMSGGGADGSSHRK